MQELKREVKDEKENESCEIVMYDYKAVSKLLGVNSNKALEFLKKFGVKIGHWQIEHAGLLKALQENVGKELMWEF